MLDLTGLDSLAADKSASAGAKGEPLDIPLADIIEDPNQPRTYFDPEALKSLALSIKQSGVKTPISLKPANADGKFIINYGARRFRASKLAGRASIPAFIDETHDDYDQAAENIQREGFTPMEIALFIKKRLEAGDKKGFIAERLGQKASFVSEHLPLLDAPGFIQDLARTGKVGAKTLYVLATAHKEFPAEVEAYVAASEEVTRAEVNALVARLKEKPQGKKAQEGSNSGAGATNDKAAMPGVLDGRAGDSGPSESQGKGDKAPEVRPQPSPTPSTKPSKDEGKGSTTEGSAYVLVMVNGQKARLVLEGSVKATLIDSGEVVEIEVGAVELVSVTR